MSDAAIEKKLDYFAPDFAELQDQADPLRAMRSEFFIPRADPEKADSGEAVYLCGNSLGLLSKRSKALVQEEMDKWAQRGVEGHFTGERPWAYIDETVTPLSAALVGAKNSDEVAIMNSLSVNLHLLMVSFYRPTKQRHMIVMEQAAFCSDHHVVRSQVVCHGLDPETSVLYLTPRANETTLRTEDIVDVLTKRGSEIALVLLPGVQFYTGQLFDMQSITAAGHAAGCVVGWDLAHAVGNVPLKLHEWGVDFAAWCSYKYLNSGPGGIAGAFVHEKHAHKTLEELPRFAGWWGQECKNRFGMGSEWQMKPGAQSYQLSNPAVLPTVSLLGSLETFKSAGLMSPLRTKSLQLTSYLEQLMTKEIVARGWATQITPNDPAQRGCQLSFLLDRAVRPVVDELTKRGVIVDSREPNVIRISPAPLYNSFVDVRAVVRELKAVLEMGSGSGLGSEQAASASGSQDQTPSPSDAAQ